MKKKMLLSLVLIVLVSLMLCKVQAVEDTEPSTPTITDTPTVTDTPEPTDTPTPSETPAPEPTGTPVPEPTTTPEPETQFTDFSKAEYKIETNNLLRPIIKIKNVSLKDKHTYYFKIGATSQIDITSENADGSLSKLDNEEGCHTSSSIEKYVELNQDLYVSILEHYYDDGSQDKVVASGVKLNRADEPKYSNAFRYTFMAKTGTQIITNFSHDSKTDRKIQIKVGKITDTNILRKIKNKDSSGFSELLSYAKKTNGIFDKKVDNEKNSTNLGYSSYDNESPILEVQGLVDNEYYFLYVKADDENGKYYDREAVTLAQASVYQNQNNDWFLFFYGDDKFEWADFGEGGETGSGEEGKGDDKKDDTLAPDKEIPQTGEKSFIILSILSVIFAGGLLTYIGYRKNNYK